MAEYQLTCKDCHRTDHRVARRHATRCPSCTLLRDLRYVTGKYKRNRKCRACAAPFRPIRARDLSHCGTCAEHYLSTKAGACGFCKRQNAELFGDLPVCVRCIKDPEVQPKIVAGLERGQRERKLANPPPPEGGPYVRVITAPRARVAA